ncbi:hypothetical protein EDD53_0602 [Pacificibacter maritimus]|uniref:Uncharacterized protein n=1 Tax=Pacificibacter maritimus TaxID=762213 RepID=A0A3N4UM14_9RHOB|nr:hypothetical protein [Pacificibacter maritimus]RPE71483.1 hypothetical protein EDD53_0602 [Pacificibacter maritimus]
MINDLKSVVTRSQGTLIEDMLGAAALLVILFGGLVAPAFF